MGRIVLQMVVSLDGFMAGPEGELDWHLVDDELHEHFNAELGAMSYFLEGRTTWELMADYWPTADADPQNPKTMREFARIWREMPKIVYSRTLDNAGWNTQIRRDVDAAEVEALKAAAAGDLSLGGADLAATFLRHGLVDVVRLYLTPVVLGAGRPAFPSVASRIHLRAGATRVFGNGVVLVAYEVGVPR